MGVDEAPVPGPLQGGQGLRRVGHGDDGLDAAVVQAVEGGQKGRPVQAVLRGQPLQVSPHGAADHLPVDLPLRQVQPEGQKRLPGGGDDGGIGVHQRAVHIPDESELLHGRLLSSAF